MYLTVTHTPTLQFSSPSVSSVNLDHVHAGFQAASSEAGLSAIKSHYFKAQPPITHFWLVILYTYWCPDWPHNDTLLAAIRSFHSSSRNKNEAKVVPEAPKVSGMSLSFIPSCGLSFTRLDTRHPLYVSDSRSTARDISG